MAPLNFYRTAYTSPNGYHSGSLFAPTLAAIFIVLMIICFAGTSEAKINSIKPYRTSSGPGGPAGALVTYVVHGATDDICKISPSGPSGQ